MLIVSGAGLKPTVLQSIQDKPVEVYVERRPGEFERLK